MPRGSQKHGIALVRDADVPLYRQIYEHFRSAIRIGQLRPGDRLPSARRLAEEFATARGTIDAAYAMLAGEGYVIGRGPAGTVVSTGIETVPGDVRSKRGGSVERGAPVGRRSLASGQLPGTSHLPRPFQLGLPSLDTFPRKIWSRVATRETRELSVADMAYPDPAGIVPLRESIAAYLASARGMTCTGEQIIVTNGYQGALDLIVAVLLGGNDRVWIEDPCYPMARDALAAAASLVPIAVDAEGLRVTDGVAKARRARLAVVTPSHQSPLGVALSLARRLALLSWASASGAFIVEDDYDGEFRYVGRPLPALKSIDRDDRVIYAGSFSKVLFPSLRLGYLVLPRALIGPFAGAARRRTHGVPSLTQRAVAAFMAEGHFARHIRRMRNLYALRRRALADGLAATFGDGISVDLKQGGMHLIVRFGDRIDDVKLAKLAQAAGLAVEALSTRRIAHACGRGLLLGFTNVAERDAPDLCRQLSRAIGLQVPR
jgi:GntR family transcriptional regulator / MocR family aminotransferase